MKNKNIITIGGGTGSFTVLSGLKNYPINLSAIVSMTDDGGSTGVLRDELGVLPPGDVRQCLVALSDSSDALRRLFNYRFESGSFKGHSFGNLFLSALEKTSHGFQKGVEEASKILNVKGEVIPVTESDVKLVMKLKNKKVLNGENEINRNYEVEETGIEKYFLSPKPKPNKKALAAIKQADAIIIGPGNLYCSVLPNLLVKEISVAIKKSKAQVIFICNLFNKKGKTEKFGLDDYVKAVEKYIGKNRIDYVVYNAQKPPRELVEKYVKKSEKPIYFNNKNSRKYKVIRAKILGDKIYKFSKSDPMPSERSFIRHDSAKLAKTIMFILDVRENKNIIQKIV
jgi:uncharacterized cofD-like protein